MMQPAMHRGSPSFQSASPSFQVDQSAAMYNSQPGSTPFLSGARVLHATPGSAGAPGFGPGMSPAAGGLSPAVGLNHGPSFNVPGSFPGYPTPSFVPTPVVDRQGMAPIAQRPAAVPRAPAALRQQRPANPCQNPCDLKPDDDECLPDECAGDAPVDPEHSFFGIDVRRFLPVLLSVSTVVGMCIFIIVIFPLMSELILFATVLKAFMLATYCVTMVCMIYAAWCDPGEMKPDGQERVHLNSAEDGDADLPKRAHKTWQYEHPIRRYDHYCKWLANCIGLLNHREFYTMCFGLVNIGLWGAAIDVYLSCRLQAAEDSINTWSNKAFLIGHLIYSLLLFVRVYSIFALHTGFITRNELANEWKKNIFYVLPDKNTGEMISVNELSDDEEFNERFDHFIYDAKRNEFDKDWMSNWYTFWMTPRWTAAQLGDF